MGRSALPHKSGSRGGRTHPPPPPGVDSNIEGVTLETPNPGTPSAMCGSASTLCGTPKTLCGTLVTGGAGPLV